MASIHRQYPRNLETTPPALQHLTKQSHSTPSSAKQQMHDSPGHWAPLRAGGRSMCTEMGSQFYSISLSGELNTMMKAQELHTLWHVIQSIKNSMSPNEKLTHSLTFTIELSEYNLLLLSSKRNALKTFIQH